MSQRLTSSQLDFNPATFRYWGDIVVTIYDILYQRNPYARYFCLGLVKDSFAPGFDIMQGDEEHPRNEEILKDPNFNDMMEKVTMAIASKRAYGYSILAKLKFADNTEEVLYWLTYKDIVQLEIKEGTKEITKLEFHPPIYATTPGNLTPIVVPSGALSKVKLLANYDKTMGLFRSEMEPIVDTLIGLTNISQQTVVKQIRVGSGVRMIQAPWSIMSNNDARAALEKSLQNMGINSLLLVPTDEEGTVKVELYFGEGAISGKEDRDMLVGDLASWTRVPVEIWLGSELGMKSSETNRKNYLNLMSKTESEEEETILQALEWEYDLVVDEVEVEPAEILIDATTDVEAIETEEPSEPVDTHIWLRWNALEEKDEAEVIAALATKFDIVLKLAQGEMMNKLGIDQEELYQLLGIELNIDESLKAKFEVEKQALKETMNSKDTEDNGDTPDGDAEAETEGEGSEGADPSTDNPEETN